MENFKLLHIEDSLKNSLLKMNFTQKSLTNVRNNIGKYIIKTPVFRFDFIDNLCGCNIFFKCENFQHTGSFKYRAALNAIKNIPSEYKSRALLLYSEGIFLIAFKAALYLKDPVC